MSNFKTPSPLLAVSSTRSNASKSSFFKNPPILPTPEFKTRNTIPAGATRAVRGVLTISPMRPKSFRIRLVPFRDSIRAADFDRLMPFTSRVGRVFGHGYTLTSQLLLHVAAECNVLVS